MKPQLRFQTKQKQKKMLWNQDNRKKKSRLHQVGERIHVTQSIQPNLLHN